MSDTPEIIDAAAIFQRFPDTWDTIYQYIKKLEQENDALNEAVESLRTTLWGTEFELEKSKKQIDGLFAELASTGADELREYRAENHQISQKASKLCYDLIARERELEKVNAALDWLNTNCVSADPIMGRSTYRWTIEHDEPDIRAAIAELRKAQV